MFGEERMQNVSRCQGKVMDFKEAYVVRNLLSSYHRNYLEEPKRTKRKWALNIIIMMTTVLKE